MGKGLISSMSLTIVDSNGAVNFRRLLVTCSGNAFFCQKGENWTQDWTGQPWMVVKPDESRIDWYLVHSTDIAGLTRAFLHTDNLHTCPSAENRVGSRLDRLVCPVTSQYQAKENPERGCTSSKRSRRTAFLPTFQPTPRSTFLFLSASLKVTVRMTLVEEAPRDWKTGLYRCKLLLDARVGEVFSFFRTLLLFLNEITDSLILQIFCKNLYEDKIFTVSRLIHTFQDLLFSARISMRTKV